MHKNALLKNCKNRLELGVSPPDLPCLLQLGAPPQDLQSPIEYSWLRHCSTPFF